MKNKAILVSFIALFAIVLTLNSVVAVVDDGFVTITDVSVDDIELTSSTPGISVSEKVPVEVEFVANKDVNENVKIRVYLEGYKRDISDSLVFNQPLKDGRTYTARFTLELPSSNDLDEDLDKDLDIIVRVSAQDEESVEKTYSLTVQRDLHSLNLLSIETPQVVIDGSLLSVDVVVQNNGHERLDNVYLRVAIPDLGVQQKVYVGDVEAQVDDTYDNIRDAINKKVYLTIPRNVMPGTYVLEVEAYNYDASTTVKQYVDIVGVESGVISSVTSKTIAVGGETTFDVVLVNPNSRMIVYSITPEESKGLIVEVTEPIVSVPADSSKTVQIKVKATNSVEKGTYVVKLNVNSESGSERQVSFTVNVDGNGKAITTTPTIGGSNFVLVLTIILVIVFVVLLVILIVLLTKRPEETEEFGETSYY